MATLFQFQQRLAKINNIAALELLLFIEIKKNEKAFIELNKAQLNDGKDNQGKLFGKYKLSTENWKRDYTPRKPKKAGEPYNFEDTGGLFDGFELLVDGTQAQFFSTDGKTEKLFLKYDGLFGLQPDNLKTVIRETILPAFIKQIRRELKLT